MPVGEVLARGDELALVLLAQLRLQPPPGGIELQERVLDESARAHAHDYRSTALRGGRRVQCGCADRSAVPVLLDLSGWGHASHRGARRASSARLVTSRESSRRGTPTMRSRGGMHGGAARSALSPPEGFVSLGRTVGVPANGAVSNMALTPHAVLALRRELRSGSYDVLHIHEPVVPDRLLGCAVLRRRAAARGHLPHLLGEPPDERLRRGRARRATAHEPAARADRRLRGRGVDRATLLRRALHDHPQRRLARGAAGDRAAPRRGARRATPLRIVFVGQAVERKGLPVLLRAFEALRDHYRDAHARRRERRRGRAHDARRPRRARAGQGLRGAQARRACACGRVCAPSLHGESFGMVLTEASPRARR